MSIGYVIVSSTAGTLAAALWLIVTDGLAGAVLSYVLTAKLVAVAMIARRLWRGNPLQRKATSRPAHLSQAESGRG